MAFVQRSCYYCTIYFSHAWIYELVYVFMFLNYIYIFQTLKLNFLTPFLKFLEIVLNILDILMVRIVSNLIGSTLFMVDLPVKMINQYLPYMWSINIYFFWLRKI